MSHFNLYSVLKQISSHCFANKKTFHDTVWGVNYNSLQLSGTFLTKYEVAIIANNTAKFLLVDVLMLKFPIQFCIAGVISYIKAHYLEMQKLLYFSIIRGSFIGLVVLLEENVHCKKCYLVCLSLGLNTAIYRFR